jgi:hypothetical protein
LDTTVSAIVVLPVEVVKGDDSRDATCVLLAPSGESFVSAMIVVS